MEFIRQYGFWIAAFIIILAFSRRNKKRKTEAKEADNKRVADQVALVQHDEEK